MSLFEKKRSVAALNEDAINSIKRELGSMLEVAASYDRVMGKTGRLVISLEGRIRGDLLGFVLYLDGMGKGETDATEIDVVNRIFDIDLWHEDYQLFRRDVSDKRFENAVPPSILIIRELGKTVQREQFRTSDGSVSPQGETTELSDLLVNGLINLYALIGSAFISADGEIVERESADLIRYLCMINRAITGASEPLPQGAAQRTMDAHVRLFGKKPKLRQWSLWV